MLSIFEHAFICVFDEICPFHPASQAYRHKKLFKISPYYPFNIYIIYSYVTSLVPDFDNL